jgi:hypothetical protein
VATVTDYYIHLTEPDRESNDYFSGYYQGADSPQQAVELARKWYPHPTAVAVYEAGYKWHEGEKANAKRRRLEPGDSVDRITTKARRQP